MIALLVGAAALAGGYRLGPGPAPGNVTSVRCAQVFTANSDWVTQITPRQRIAGEVWGAAVELPVVASYAPDGSWSRAGIGMARLAVLWFSDERSRKSAIEVSFPAGPAGQVAAWGSISRETLEGREVLFTVEEVLPGEHPVLVRFGVGVYHSPHVSFRDAFQGRPSIELAAAQVLSFPGPVSLVWEAEALIDRTPLSVRFLPRLTPREGLSVDAGLQIPVVAYVSGVGTVQLISKVSWGY